MFNEKNLMECEYFPVELPPCFLSSQLSENFSYFLSQTSLITEKDSVPFFFSCYKSEVSRRRLSIPNPYHYIKLIKIIIDHDADLKKIYNESRFSLTKPNIDQSNTESRAFNRISNNPNDTRKLHEKLFKDNTICLKLDISNFFDSIYTHSIPWAIHGKSNAKLHRSTSELWGNELDKALQSLNSSQTHGILVGNAISRLVAEIILCKIDYAIAKKFPDIDFCRYVDDYSFYLKNSINQNYSISDVESFIREQLLEYDLILNENKTKKLTAPFVLENNGMNELRSIVVVDAYDYFNRLICMYDKYKDIALLKYGLRILYYKINNTNFERLFPLLMNLWVRFPSLAEYIVKIFYNLKELIKGAFVLTLKKSLSTIIVTGLRYHYDCEVVWASWCFKLFNLKLNGEILKTICKSHNDLAIIIALDYCSSNKTQQYKKCVKEIKNRIINFIKIDEDKGIFGTHWLLIYELIKKEIILEDSKFNFVSKNKFFKALKDSEIDFYNNSIIPLLDKKGDEDGVVTKKEFNLKLQELIKLMQDQNNEKINEILMSLEYEISRYKRWEY